jgi:hypothetical protein
MLRNVNALSIRGPGFVALQVLFARLQLQAAS